MTIRLIHGRDPVSGQPFTNESGGKHGVVM